MKLSTILSATVMFATITVNSIANAGSIYSNVNIDEMTEEQYQQYCKKCPYGDAIVVNKAERDFLGKEVGVGVDCVNWDNDKQVWVAVQFKPGYNKVVEYDPHKYDVYTMDGKLLVNAKGDVMIELSYIEKN